MKRPRQIKKIEKTIDNNGYLTLLESYKQSRIKYRTAYYKFNEAMKEIKYHEENKKRFIQKSFYHEMKITSLARMTSLGSLLRTLEKILNIPENERIDIFDN